MAAASRRYSARATRAIPSTVRMSRPKESQSLSHLIAAGISDDLRRGVKIFLGRGSTLSSEGWPVGVRSAMLRVMKREKVHFDAPSPIERLFSRVFGALVGL